MVLFGSGLSVRDSKFGQALSVSGQGSSASHFTVRGNQKIVGRLDAESFAAIVGSFTSVGWTSPVGFLNAADVVLYSFISVGSFANLAGKLTFQGGIIITADFKASGTGAFVGAFATTGEGCSQIDRLQLTQCQVIYLPWIFTISLWTGEVLFWFLSVGVLVVGFLAFLWPSPCVL
jgi:hypothetical protein